MDLARLEKSGDNCLAGFDFGFAFRYDSVSRATAGIWVDAAGGSHELLTAYLFAGGEFFIPLSAIEGRLQGVAALVGFLLGIGFPKPQTRHPTQGASGSRGSTPRDSAALSFVGCFCAIILGSIGNFPTKTKAWYGIDA
jgi:hypothetical protein